jgi:CheY-like chemotaxis protein
VLAVDDNILNQTLLRKQLQRGGYEVSVASSGGEALGLMLARRFDVVLMDLEMPGMDGIETVRRYRAEEAARGLPFVPIIALTGHAPVDYRLRAIEAGMNGFLTKPYRIQELLETLESSLPPAGSPTDGN